MIKSRHIPGHTSVRLSTLREESRLAMDIFVPVGDRPVKYSAAGETLDADRMSRLRNFKYSKVWIRESDETKYRTYLTDLISRAESDPKMDMASKTTIVSSAAESAASDIMEKPEDKGTYLGSLEHFERFAKFLKSNEGSFKEILRLSSVAGEQDYISHGVQVAALSLFLVEKLGLVRDDKHQTSIITGTFLHDIGSEKSEIPRGESSKLNPEQKKLWDKHPRIGADLLNNKDYVDKQVLDIILEHEEIPDGSGFPRSLTGQKMDPVSIQVSLANSFDHTSQKYKADKTEAHKEFMKLWLGKFDLKHVELVGAFIKEFNKV
jgi:putative nucleotidyltransferase with HDIG domain